MKPVIAQSIRQGFPRKHLQLSEKQIGTLKNIKDLVLAIALVTGTITLATLAPNIFQYLDKMPWARRTYRSRNTKLKDQEKKVIRSIYYLKTQGYVELIPEGEDFKVKIVKKGRKKVRQMRFDSLSVPKMKTWNGHWWIVLADIPSKDYRRRADFFRDKLKTMNFYPLQRTGWVYPFDPRDEVDFVSAYYGVERFVTTMEAVTVDSEDKTVLKKYFKETGIL